MATIMQRGRDDREEAIFIQERYSAYDGEADGDLELAFRLQMEEAIAASSAPWDAPASDGESDDISSTGSAGSADAYASLAAIADEEAVNAIRAASDRALALSLAEEDRARAPTLAADRDLAVRLAGLRDASDAAVAREVSRGRAGDPPSAAAVLVRFAAVGAFGAYEVTDAPSSESTGHGPTVVSHDTCAGYAALISALQDPGTRVRDPGVRIRVESDASAVLRQISGDEPLVGADLWRLRSRVIELTGGPGADVTWAEVSAAANSACVRAAAAAAGGDAAAAALAAMGCRPVSGPGGKGKGPAVAAAVPCACCMEPFSGGAFFVATACGHACFCAACMAAYAEAKALEGVYPIPCPYVGDSGRCKQPLVTQDCLMLCSPRAGAAHVRTAAIAAVPDRHKLYCPHKGCSELLIMPDAPKEAEAAGSSASASAPIAAVLTRMAPVPVDTPSVCPACAGLLCLRCKVTWHEEITCATFQALPESMRAPDDVAFLVAAGEAKWRPCPGCKNMVEKSQGCNHMNCRCSFEFCYLCGAAWEKQPSPEPGVAAVSGRCPNGCDLFREEDLLAPVPAARGLHALMQGLRLGGVARAAPAVRVGRTLPDGSFCGPGHRAYKRRICKFWEDGHCRHGANCTFAHGDDDIHGGHGGMEWLWN